MSEVKKGTRILRLIHRDNLEVVIRRAGMHAPNHTPEDGLTYRPIHNVDIQRERKVKPIACGPGGIIYDHVPFYFGAHSPMLLKLKTGQVPGYDEGQEPLIYLVVWLEDLINERIDFVFSDAHGIVAITSWFDNPSRLSDLDWGVIGDKQWADTPEDGDRKRRKQAECLVHRLCPWRLVRGIVVQTEVMGSWVQSMLDRFPGHHHTALAVRVDQKREWFY